MIFKTLEIKYNRKKSKNISLKTLLSAISDCIWVLVPQKAGISPKLVGTKYGTQSVYEIGGSIVAEVCESVSIYSEVDVNLSAINGKSNTLYEFGGSKNFVLIPMITTYPSRE